MTVVDASIWVSIISGREPNHEWSRRWLAGQVGSGVTIPVLALAETAGAVARRTGSIEDGRTAMRTILATPGLRVVSVDAELGHQAAEMAAVYRLRGADAVYVAVAHLLGLLLATLDTEMRERASTVLEIIAPR